MLLPEVGSYNVPYYTTSRKCFFFLPQLSARDIMELVSSKLPPDPFGVENILQGVENQTELLDGLENRDDDAAAGCFIGGAGKRMFTTGGPTISLRLCISQRKSFLGMHETAIISARCTVWYSGLAS